MSEAELGKALRAAVDQCGDAELLHEATQLTGRCSALGEIDEVHADASLGEESLCFPRCSALLRAEDLDFHVVQGATSWNLRSGFRSIVWRIVHSESNSSSGRFFASNTSDRAVVPPSRPISDLLPVTQRA